MSFYDKYVELCSAAKKTPSGVAKEIGIHKSSVSCWKTGRNNPSDITIAAIAKYFNVPVSYFSDNSETQNTPIVVSLDEIKELPKDERLLLSYYRKMNKEEQKIAEIMLKSIAEAKE